MPAASQSAPAPFARAGCRTTMLLLCVFLLNGCRIADRRIVEAPLPFEEQQAEILAITPLGTSLPDAEQRLADAGIEGSRASSGDSIYYCDLWERPDGARWHLRVALLFDEQGKLYATRPSNANVIAGDSESDTVPQSGSLANKSAETPTLENATPTTAKAHGSSRRGRRTYLPASND